MNESAWSYTKEGREKVAVCIDQHEVITKKKKKGQVSIDQHEVIPQEKMENLR